MAKVHFFKLAQELKENPNILLKKLAAGGIKVMSSSSTIDEAQAQQIREFCQHHASTIRTDVEPELTSEPEVTVPQEAAPAPVVVPEVAPPAAPAPPAPPAAPVAPPPTPELPPATRKIVLTQGGGKSVQRADAKPGAPPPPPGDKTRKPGGRPNLLITENDGGLSADQDFGIVKAAGVVPLPAPIQRPRPPMGGQGGPPRPGGRPGEGRPMQGGPGGPRPGGPRPPMGGAPAAPDATGAKGPAKGGPPRPGDAKKKQKRTVFSDKDKGPNRLAPARGSQYTSTVIRSRRKRRGEAKSGGGGGDAYVLEEPVIITGPITVHELAEMAHVTPAQIISQLIGMGVLATINQMIEPEQAVTALEKLDIEAHFGSDLAEQASWRLTATTTGGATTGTLRPPVVTILGHVDHGKTTLLDSIRNTHVTAQEFGGITQHIGAYQVEIKGQKITFLDTPGHAAFTAMRARGANLTDIAILVVAADDGVQPQTIEAIDHARAAKVPIIVAINKVDLPDAQPEIVKQALSGYGLVSEDYGGDVIMVPLSAKKGLNIEQLLEMILLVSEVQELRAEADKPGRGAVVESKLDKQVGPMATMLVQEGTLKVGDALIVGMVSGKIRAMTDDKGRPIKEAGPSTPVVITGLAEVPVAGDLFESVDDERKAREIAEMRQQKARVERLQTHISLQNLSSMVASGIVQDLNIIVKSDVAGSIEAISQALSQVTQNEIRVNIIHAGVGDITESDVLLASASNAIIVGFHVHIEALARSIAEETGIDVRLYQVIYDLVDDVEKAMVGMLAPIFEEVVLGHAEVRAVFKLTRAGTIAGSYIKDGLVRRGAKVRILRGGEKILESTLDSLKHLKDDVREMAQGFECGIGVDNFNAWHEGDIIEAYVIKELRRETL